MTKFKKPKNNADFYLSRKCQTKVKTVVLLYKKLFNHGLMACKFTMDLK